MFCQSN